MANWQLGRLYYRTGRLVGIPPGIVALLDKSGAFVGCISAAELGGIMRSEGLAHELLLAVIHGDIAQIFRYPGMLKVVVQSTATNAQALSTMTAHNLASLAVVGEDNHLRGVIERDQLVSKTGVVPYRRPFPRRVMVTVGIDLASQPSNMAVCAVTWDESVVVDVPTTTADDQLLLEFIGRANRMGIDVALGWPLPFVRALTSYHEGQPWTAGHGEPVQLRRTDQAVRQLTGKRPLSVSTDKIGVPAMRAAQLLSGIDL